MRPETGADAMLAHDGKAGWIRVENVVKSYSFGQGGRHVALSNVTASVSSGEFTCLVGPSGCGKSTLLYLIGGLLQPDSGSVTLGTTATAFAFQEARLLPWRTVRDNVLFALHRFPSDRARQRADDVVELVGLHDVADRYPGQLSGGMQQRVSIARALAPDPAILLMDEPFSSLDEMTARRLRVELLAIWERLRTTVVFVTHNALEAAYLADRIVIMRPGSIAGEMIVPLGRPRNYEDPRLFDVYRSVVAQLHQTGAASDTTEGGT